MIFYRIIEKTKEVQVIAVYYSGSNWQKNIKYRQNVLKEEHTCGVLFLMEKTLIN